MRQRTVQDFFDKAALFIAAFKQVKETGFFDNFSVTSSSNEGYFVFVNIQATGLLPDSKQDLVRGIIPYIDPVVVVDQVRLQVSGLGYKMDSGSCETKLEDWPRFDRTGERIIGSRGKRVTLKMSFSIKWKDRRKKPS